MSEKNNKNIRDFLIRDFQPKDYEQVDLLWKETGLGSSFRGDNLQVILNTISNGGKMLILEEKCSGTIAGTSWLTNDFRRIYLHHFCIKPEFQNKGLSHFLCNKCIKFAKEKKMQIKLEVHKNNIIAESLYKKHGFTYLGDYNLYIIRNYSNIKL
ncbi:MAG: hypothetical protein COX07_04340 [Bacteroidetes bacterium CG23_combo_of_CG06-09_8_20_14_all_32_9]|nr:MAG: hypothetical protein COX07_04340 [Bacteroidetes bacterium CG23_combo_of_CG06-09_8_20_14_all_32_9]